MNMRLVRVVNVEAVVVARPVIEAVAAGSVAAVTAGSVAASAAVVRGTVVDEPVLVLAVEVVEIVVVSSCQKQPNCGLTGSAQRAKFSSFRLAAGFF